MSKRELLAAITELDGYGIVVTESDEELLNAIDELGLADGSEDS